MPPRKKIIEIPKKSVLPKRNKAKTPDTDTDTETDNDEVIEIPTPVEPEAPVEPIEKKKKPAKKKPNYRKEIDDLKQLLKAQEELITNSRTDAEAIKKLLDAHKQEMATNITNTTKTLNDEFVRSARSKILMRF